MILIVDDNPAMRRMIRSIVEVFDAECRECADGAEAIKTFERFRPELVLMDLAMRRINGLDATRRIIARFPAARIAIVTNYNDANLRRAATEAGACAFIAKENLLDLRRLFAH